MSNFHYLYYPKKAYICAMLELNVLMRLRARHFPIDGTIRGEFLIGSFSPSVTSWINFSRNKKDLITMMFVGLLRGERYNIATLAQKAASSRNSVVKNLAEGVSLGIFESVRDGNTTYFHGSQRVWGELLLSAEKECSLVSPHDRKTMAKIFRDLAAETVERKSLGLDNAQEIMLHLRDELLEQATLVRRAAQAPQNLPFLNSYPTDWILSLYSSSSATEVIILALGARSHGELINLSQIKKILNASTNTLRNYVKTGVELGILETERRGREIFVRATDLALEAFLSNYRASFLTLGPQDLHILADFCDI